MTSSNIDRLIYDARNRLILDRHGAKVAGEICTDGAGAMLSAAPVLLKAAKRALNVLKAQGESVQPFNVLSALDDAIKQAEGKQ